MKIIERLEVEHLRHAGKNNGDLNVSFRQFVEEGLSKRNILAALDLGEALGLLRTIRPDNPTRDLRAPNAYELTYVPARGKPNPTDEWRKVTLAQAQQLVEAFRAKDRLKAAAKRAP